jgi:hypothetical protein
LATTAQKPPEYFVQIFPTHQKEFDFYVLLQSVVPVIDQSRPGYDFSVT